MAVTRVTTTQPSGCVTTIHRAPTRGARTSREGAAAGSGAVAQHRGADAAPSLNTAAWRGIPWRATRSSTRAQGGAYPLTVPLRPGHLAQGLFRPPDPASLCTLVP